MTSRLGDERELDLEERRIRLETEQEILDAKRKELERLQDLEERRSARSKASSDMWSSAKSSSASDEPDEKRAAVHTRTQIEPI